MQAVWESVSLMVICVIIVTKDDPLRTYLNVNGTCLVPHTFTVAYEEGLGKARDAAIQRSFQTWSDFIVMLDNDLKLSTELWSWLFQLKEGTYAMVKVGEHYSTRVFAIHRRDYFKIGGFNKNIKYVFEDGDFAIRAKKQGLILRIIPNTLFKHKQHPRNRYRNLTALNWEYCQMLVKYKRYVFRNLFEFYWRPFDYRIKLHDLATKIPFTLYWILRGTN